MPPTGRLTWWPGAPESAAPSVRTCGVWSPRRQCAAVPLRVLAVGTLGIVGRAALLTRPGHWLSDGSWVLGPRLRQACPRSVC